ncbi:Na(+)/H(+) antiporter subunit D [Candidatus Spongiihabitans sp.]|uniref:Na(+)/H(+) antiporter subunit D n=1 Tax=Candidatus Spongiihabitans sp. TaxID=3101308 RepID=UPI003C6F24E7
MINAPFLVFFIGAAIVLALPGRSERSGRLRKIVMLAVPLAGLINLLTLDQTTVWQLQWLDLDLVLFTSDRLSFIFGILFHIAAIIATIYAWHVKDRPQQAVALLYPGSALGIVFAGDFLTLFVFWECLALTSVFFITARATPRAIKSAIRYLVFQVVSGVLLLTGSLLMLHQTGGIAIGPLDMTDPGAIFFLLAFGIKAAFPMLHNWLTDAYPEATVSGTVFLGAFTTKVAVYVLARTFTGLDALIYIGMAMACFPIFYAVIENDLRRVLSYSMINQIGFMVCGIGIGTELAVNGAVAHAFNDVIFKGLLMMSMGAVLFRTGDMRASNLGGLFRTMPKTTALCLVGAASISAFPLFSGFVSKSMVMAALLLQHHEFVWLAMLFASAGVFHHAGIKIPYFAFFAHDSGLRPEEAPRHMLIAMSIAAALCIFVGSFPQLLYRHLPFAVDYAPFELPHVVEQVQLLFFSALAFIWLQLKNIYPAELKSTNIDSEWLYRKFWPAIYTTACAIAQKLHLGINGFASATATMLTPMARKQSYDLLMPWSVRAMLMVVMAFLGVVLGLFYLV